MYIRIVYNSNPEKNTPLSILLWFLIEFAKIFYSWGKIYKY